MSISAEEAIERFSELRGRLIRLRNDKRDKRAPHQAARAQAARLYRQCADTGLEGFDPQWCSLNFTDDPVSRDDARDELCWSMAWQQVTRVLSHEHEHDGALTAPLTFGGGVVRSATRTDKVKTTVVDYPADRIDDAIEDDAAAIGVLLRRMAAAADAHLDHAYPATWYAAAVPAVFNPQMLDKARRDGRIEGEQIDGRWHYPLRSVMRVDRWKRYHKALTEAHKRERQLT